jgi:signal transduction histidine kinase
VPVAVIRKWPGPAIAILIAANSVFLLFGRLNWPVTAMIGWVIALAACPLMLSRRRAVQVLAGSELVVVLAIGWRSGSYTPWDATAAEALAVVAAWGAGELLQARRQTAIERAAAADQVRSLTERDALARERAAIARELHDVVAHHVSMIAVRAGTTPYGSPAQYRDAFDEIARDARTALAELRVVLGVLRDPAAVSVAAPQPGIRDVEHLLARVRGTGADVQLQVVGPARPLPASAELCGYRIVQEAVTNAGRHAPGSRVLVSLRYRPAELEITVVNAAAAGLPAASGREAGSPGFGLIGLRERVGLLGGEFWAGRPDGGGFTVRAVLPVAPGPAELEAESA